MSSLVNSSEDELVRFFCTYPEQEFSMSELSEQVDFSKPWISEKVDDLEQRGFLGVEKKGNMKIARFSRSEENLRLKSTLNLDQFYSSGILEDIIGEYSYPEAVVLFGSFAKGEDSEESDVDIAVISNSDGEVSGEVMGRELSIADFNPGDVPENMLETLANGVVVYGYLSMGGRE